MNETTILWNDRNYASAYDVIEQGFDPEATLRDCVKRGDITMANLDEQADEIWASFVELDIADSQPDDEDQTVYYRELRRANLRQYLLDLIEGNR